MGNQTLRNCLVPCCEGQYFMKVRNSKAVITASDFFESCRHFRKNVYYICSIVCPNDELSDNHKKLNVLKFNENYYRNRNLNSDIIISKNEMRICDHQYCFKNWCFNVY